MAAQLFRIPSAGKPVVLLVVLATLALWSQVPRAEETSSCIQCHTDAERLAATYTKALPPKSELIEGVG